MHRLIINKLGPIDHCDLTQSQFAVLTGFQASGKSTIVKSVFYFRTIKDDICSIAEEIALGVHSDESIGDEVNLRNRLISRLREKFLRTFGSSWSMDMGMFLEYYYTDDCVIRIYLKESTVYPTPNYIWIELSDELRAFFFFFYLIPETNATGITKMGRQTLSETVHTFFNDSLEIVYIPAGRSMLTLLSEQLSYIYTTMKDAQKRTLDYCTQNYIERILSLKSEFDHGLEGLVEYYGVKNKTSAEGNDLAFSMINKILRGKYLYSSGEERIILKEGKYVKVNFASSGQQESVWILNLLFYYYIKGKPVMFIIEEPESHLFPESQKFITELIALVANSGHSVMITTHSPYVLGTLNNLLFADQVSKEWEQETTHIIPKQVWIQVERFTALFVKEGTADECMDHEINLIKNELIDEISKTINQDFDEMAELSFQAEE